MKSLTRPGTQRGATLIEVLVTVVVLAIGLLGIASLQLVAMRKSQGAVQDSLATMYTYSVLDSMRANGTQAKAGAYNGTFCAATKTTGTLVLDDLAFWVNNMQTQLGDGACGVIACDNRGECRVEVQWTDVGDRRNTEARKVVTEAFL